MNFHCCVHIQFICYLPAMCSAVYYKIIIAVFTYSPSAICLLSAVLSITKLSLLCSLTVHLLFACYLLCCLLQNYHCCVHLQSICYLPAICSAVYYKIIIAVFTYSPSAILLLSVVLSITKLSLLCSLTVHLLFACYL